MDKDEKYLLEIQRKRRKDKQQATTKRRRQGESIPPSMGELLTTFFAKDPETLAQIEETKALEAWPRYVGEAAARVSKAVRLRQGTLTVYVKDPMWMQQLSFLKQGILAKYKQDFPKIPIRQLYFSRG